MPIAPIGQEARQDHRATNSGKVSSKLIHQWSAQILQNVRSLTIVSRQPQNPF